ncbi:DNA replication complex GINS protein SLD5 [Athalia rosae]|uniref:DNA replication complex GINS protein SLD5 n=1 Tax=Athalia rosae TaxID=37344 RepID=UPI00062585D2|nr:DNA replication complex GINS protein SLD5 [Athalia rosae]
MESEARPEPQSTADLSDSSDGEGITAARVLQEIENAWLNEKFAPEILPHQSDFVDCMLQQISHMEDNMQKLKKTDLRFTVHKMEIDRIRFVIASYLRTRLEKIEQFAISILSDEAKRPPDEGYLTPGELKFAKEYVANIETLFTSIALQYMPRQFQAFDTKQLMLKPNLLAHVFLRVNRDVKGIALPGTNEIIDLDAGTQHILPYQPIASLLKEGAVRLI